MKILVSGLLSLRLLKLLEEVAAISFNVDQIKVEIFPRQSVLMERINSLMRKSSASIHKLDELIQSTSPHLVKTFISKYFL